MTTLYNWINWHSISEKAQIEVLKVQFGLMKRINRQYLADVMELN